MSSVCTVEKFAFGSFAKSPLVEFVPIGESHVAVGFESSDRSLQPPSYPFARLCRIGVDFVVAVG